VDSSNDREMIDEKKRRVVLFIMRFYLTPFFKHAGHLGKRLWP
jgi:hypothetical protein